jgi:hypothetical protein
MGILSSLFGKKKSVDFAELISQGAQIIDVRTPSEYSNGHLKASKNIPLDRLASSVSKINKNKPVITCCASGIGYRVSGIGCREPEFEKPET